jgi:hypothetical protein
VCVCVCVCVCMHGRCLEANGFGELADISPDLISPEAGKHGPALRRCFQTAPRRAQPPAQGPRARGRLPKAKGFPKESGKRKACQQQQLHRPISHRKPECECARVCARLRASAGVAGPSSSGGHMMPLLAVSGEKDAAALRRIPSSSACRAILRTHILCVPSGPG